MTTTDAETGGRFDAVVDTATSNRTGGASVALRGLIHVLAGGIGLAMSVPSPNSIRRCCSSGPPRLTATGTIDESRFRGWT